MFRQDDDGADPKLPRWLVPWIYPVGLGVVGAVFLVVWVIAGGLIGR